MDWREVLSAVAPTVASAIVGPLGGAAVSAIGAVLGIDKPTQDRIKSVIVSSQLTADQIAKLKELEMQYQQQERELGFKYSELAFQDRDSARKANVAGNVQRPLFWLSLVLLIATLGTEGIVLFHGYPATIPEIIVGRVLGLMDAVALLVLNYWYGTSASSANKDSLLAAKKE